MFCFQATTYICSKTNQLITLLAKLQRDNMFVERSGLRLQLRKKGVCWHAIFFLQFTYYEVKLWCSVWYYKDKLIYMYYIQHFVLGLFLYTKVSHYHNHGILQKPNYVLHKCTFCVLFWGTVYMHYNVHIHHIIVIN